MDDDKVAEIVQALLKKKGIYALNFVYVCPFCGELNADARKIIDHISVCKLYPPRLIQQGDA